MGDLSDKEECSISPSQPRSPSRNLVRCHGCSCSWPTKVVVPYSMGGVETMKPIKEETSVGVGDSLNLGSCFGITNLGSMAVPVDIPGTTSTSGNLQLSTGGPASSLEIGTSENCSGMPVMGISMVSGTDILREAFCATAGILPGASGSTLLIIINLSWTSNRRGLTLMQE